MFILRINEECYHVLQILRDVQHHKGIAKVYKEIRTIRAVRG